MRLRTSLSILAVAAAVPLLAFAVLAAYVVVEQERASLIEGTKARNRATMSAIDGVVSDAINTLNALTVLPSLEHDDLQAFHALAVKVLATQPAWNNVLLHDAQGRQLVNASLPWGTQLLATATAPESIRKVLATGRPAIDDLAVAPLLGNRMSLPVRVPVMRDGKVVYVLTAAVAPEAFQRLVLAQQVPSDWVSGLTDAKGRLIARLPAKETATMASGNWMSHVAERKEGWYRGRTLEDKDTFTAFLRSDLTGWAVGYAMPATLVTAGWQRAGLLLAAGALLSLVAAVGAGLWLNRRIHTPLAQLARAAGGVGGTSAQTKIESNIDEVAALSTALAERDRHLRQADEALRRKASELEQANTNKSQFLALLSHELRNPLAPLSTCLSILAKRPDDTTVAQTHAIMARQVAHITRLIDDLLDMSRIDRGSLQLRRERVAIHSVVMDAVETIKPKFEAKQQELVVRCPPAPMYVDGDPVRLCQILLNLLGNASKFAPHGGRVELATSLDGDEVVIAVADNGIGLAEEDKRRIFDMFVQVDSSESQLTTGLGLGLAIARSLVEQHDGRIDVQSAGPGKGATFTVRLPKVSGPDAGAARSDTPRTAGGRRILVVDDNVDAADSLAQMLRLHGHHVQAAYDGHQGLEAARRFKPEIAFIDLNMPRMDGIQLARALRAEEWAAGIRLIAVTGMGQKSDVDSTLAGGFDAHLTKPAPVEDILRFAGLGTDNVVQLRSDRAANR